MIILIDNVQSYIHFYQSVHVALTFMYYYYYKTSGFRPSALLQHPWKITLWVQICVKVGGAPCIHRMFSNHYKLYQ